MIQHPFDYLWRHQDECTERCLPPSSAHFSVTYLGRLPNPTDAQSHVIAEAIAVFQFNNTKREERGLPRLESMMIPCITTLSGARPTFYLVPVTKASSTAVTTAQYPAVETTVLKCVTAPKHHGKGYEIARVQKTRGFTTFSGFQGNGKESLAECSNWF